MEIERLQKLAQESETLFNQLSIKRTEISEEMLRVAGENRAYKKLIAQQEELGKKSKKSNK